MRYLLVTGINPEPWTAPDISIAHGKGGRPYPQVSKNARLRAFQEALKESIQQAYPDLKPYEPDTRLRVSFIFWRQIDSYTKESGRTASRNVADATNMTKAAEDALQGVLYHNDRHNKWTTGVIADEGPDVQPMILVTIEPLNPADKFRNYEAIVHALTDVDRPAIPGNVVYLSDETEELS